MTTLVTSDSRPDDRPSFDPARTLELAQALVVALRRKDRRRARWLAYELSKRLRADDGTPTQQRRANR